MAGQEWTTTDLGGTLTSETLSRNLRRVAQPNLRFRQLVRPEMAFGAHNGQSITFKKSGDLEDLGQEIGEKDDVPETQGRYYSDSLTVKEYSMSVPYTWTLSLLAKLSVEDDIVIKLMNNMAKTLDRLAAAQFRAADVVYTPTGTTGAKTRTITTNGTAGAVSERPITMWDVKNIVDRMRETYNTPAYQNNQYLCIGTPSSFRGIKDDSEFQRWSLYGRPENLFAGEIGEAYGVRFIEENYSLTSSLPGGCGEMIFIGWDAVVEAVAYAEEIQAKLAIKYGRDKGLRWTYMGGWKKTWSFSEEGQVRLVRVYSA